MATSPPLTHLFPAIYRVYQLPMSLHWCRRLWKARAPLRRDGWTVSSDGLTWFCWAFLFRGRSVKGTNGMLPLLPIVDDDLGMLPGFCVLLVVLIWKDDVQKSKCWCSSWSLVEFLTHFSQVYEHELCKSASFTPSFRKMDKDHFELLLPDRNHVCFLSCAHTPIQFAKWHLTKHVAKNQHTQCAKVENGE